MILQYPLPLRFNQYASPVVGVAQEINRYANPWIKTIKKSAPGAYDYINGIEEYAHQKPGDAAAVAAATYLQRARLLRRWLEQEQRQHRRQVVELRQ